MGAVSDTAWEFCEIVYPENYWKQDELFKALQFSPANETLNPLTVVNFRKFFDEHGKWPNIELEDLGTMIKENERKPMTEQARSNAVNILISAVEDMAASGSSEEKKIIAADAVLAVIRKTVKEELAKERQYA